MPREKVIEEIGFELKRIEKLFEGYELLLKKVRNQKPNFIELGSLAVQGFRGSEFKGLKIQNQNGETGTRSPER